MFTITYKKAHNPNSTNFQNEARNKASRIFADKDSAQAFAQTVEVIAIYDCKGNKVKW